MQCNIDQRGRKLRLIGGGITLAVAVGLAAVTAAGMLPAWVWFVAAGAAVGGGLQLFEGMRGWCALRAMGIRTPW